MKTNLKYLGVAAVALTGALVAAPAAQAQSVAVADFDAAVVKTKAFVAANEQIKATYKTQIAQTDALKKEMQTLLAPFDLNKDSQIDDNELAAAQANPGWAAVVQKQTLINTTEAPVIRAQAYVFSQVAAKLDTAAQAVITSRGLSLILKPQTVVWANQVGNITPAITAELDKLVPTASSTPPVGWQPGQASTGAPAPTTPGATVPTPGAPVKKPAGR
jgi:outer membrane protein